MAPVGLAHWRPRWWQVLWPYMAWDTYSRDEGLGAAASMARLLHDTGADGMNMDTASIYI